MLFKLLRHTPAETLAWAKAREIEPAGIAALERRVSEARPAAAANCCSEQSAEPACCQAAEPAGIDDTICSDYQSLTADPVELPADEHAPPPADDSSRPGMVILRAMLACGGIVAQWAAASVSLPPPASVRHEIAWPSVAAIRLDDERALGTAGPPDLPPPRLS